LCKWIPFTSTTLGLRVCNYFQSNCTFYPDEKNIRLIKWYRIARKKNVLFLFRLLFNYSRYCSKEERGQGNNSPKARLDKGSSIGRVTSRSRRRPAAGRHGMLQENNKQKFARNFGFKMILAGGYQMRAVAVMRSFPMYGYKVMINFRTSSFTDCSRVLPSLFPGLPLLSVSSYVLIPLLPFF